LEEYEHAKARGAKIYAELTGYGVTSDGYDMVAPSGEGAVRCMKMALKTTRNKINYINTHGTSTPVGDITELNSINETFFSTFVTIGKGLAPSSISLIFAEAAIKLFSNMIKE